MRALLAFAFLLLFIGIAYAATAECVDVRDDSSGLKTLECGSSDSNCHCANAVTTSCTAANVGTACGGAKCLQPAACTSGNCVCGQCRATSTCALTEILCKVDSDCGASGGCACGRCASATKSGDTYVCTPLNANTCYSDSDCGLANACACGRCVSKRAWYTGQYVCMSDTWKTWLPVASAGVIVALLIVAVAYMFAIGFDLPELKMWAKAELYQALASAILVAGLLSMSWVMLDEGAAKILGSSVNPYSIADSYLNQLSGHLTQLYGDYYNWNFGAEVATTISLYKNAQGQDINLAPFMKPISESLHLSAYYIIQFLVYISMWKSIMLFFKQSAFSVLMPLGVILRIFPPTRGAGGVMIATAIGFFIVFPTTFAFISMMSEEDNALGQDLMNAPQTLGVDLAEFNACQYDMESVARSAESQADPAMMAEINKYNSFLPAVWLRVFFYPMVVTAVTITFIKVLSPLLGSDISEVGQGLLKLV